MRGVVLACALALAGAAGTASAQTRTMVVHIGVDPTGGWGIDNAVNYLMTDPRFSLVDSYDALFSPPDLNTLLAYDSVLVVTDNRAGTLTGGGPGTALGNVLDDYYLAGGRVSMAAFSPDAGIGVDGDIAPYLPYTGPGGNGGAGSMDLANKVDDPVFDGVLSVSSEYSTAVNLANGGVALAYYFDGNLAVARSDDFGIYLVNVFPGNQIDYQNGTDFGHLIANSLVARIPSPGSAALLALAAIGAGRRRR
jgi:hypothetical protein